MTVKDNRTIKTRFELVKDYTFFATLPHNAKTIYYKIPIGELDTEFNAINITDGNFDTFDSYEEVFPIDNITITIG